MTEHPSGQQPTDYLYLGPHRYRIAGSRLYLESHGRMKAEEAVQLREMISGLRKNHDHVTVLMDLRDSAGPTAGARSEMSQLLLHDGQSVRMALVGASQAVQTIAFLMSNAMRLIHGTKLLLRFFASDSEATAWLDEIPV